MGGGGWVGGVGDGWLGGWVGGSGGMGEYDPWVLFGDGWLGIVGVGGGCLGEGLYLIFLAQMTIPESKKMPTGPAMGVILLVLY